MPIKPRKRKDGKKVYDIRAEYGGIRVQRTVQTTITDTKRVESKLLQELISGRYEILKNRENTTFRHFWTKMMFEAGNDPATIQIVGRWRDFETMIKYCYTTKSQEHDAVNKLSKHLERRTAKILPWRGYNGNEAKNSNSWAM